MTLTWHGITLYGVIDVGVQYDTHSAPFTPYRPAASGNIVRQNSRQSVVGLTPSNMGQSRVGLHGAPGALKNDEWSGGIPDQRRSSTRSPEKACRFSEVTGRKTMAGTVGDPDRRCRRQLGGPSPSRPPGSVASRRDSAPSPLAARRRCCWTEPSSTTPTTMRPRSVCSAPQIPIPAAAPRKTTVSIRQ